MAEKNLGFGNGIELFVFLAYKKAAGLDLDAKQQSEYDMLKEILNTKKISLGFDCDGDGVADELQTVEEIVKQTAAGNCACRLVDADLPVRKRSKSERRKRRR